MYRRKMKNRIAAQTARDRKKMKMGDLEDLVKRLENENDALQYENAKLRSRNGQLNAENSDLKKQLLEVASQVASPIESVGHSSNVTLGSAVGTGDAVEGLRIDGLDFDNSDAALQAILQELLDDSEQFGKQLGIEGPQCELHSGTNTEFGQARVDSGAFANAIATTTTGVAEERSASVASSQSALTEEEGSDVMFLSAGNVTAAAADGVHHPSSPFGVVPDVPRSPSLFDNNHNNSINLMDFDILDKQLMTNKKEETNNNNMDLFDLDDADLTPFLFNPQIGSGWVDSFTDLFEVQA